MSSRNEFARARERFQLEAPISEDVNLIQRQPELATYIEQWSAPDEMVELALQEMARDLLRHVARKRSRSKASRRSPSGR